MHIYNLPCLLVNAAVASLYKDLSSRRHWITAFFSEADGLFRDVQLLWKMPHAKLTVDYFVMIVEFAFIYIPAPV